MSRRNLSRLAPLLGVLSFTAALAVLFHALREVHPQDIARHLAAVPPGRVLLALALTAIDFLALALIDLLALRYIERSLPLAKLGLASFVGYAFSHTLGWIMVSGGPVRYRFYAAWGLSTLEVAKIVAFAGLATGLGFLGAGAAAFLIQPLAIPPALHLPWASARGLGAICFLAIAAFLVWCARRRDRLKLGAWEFPLPGFALALAVTAAAALEWVIATAVLFVLLPGAQTGLAFLPFVGVFLLAQIAGVASTVPAGLGVFETVVLVLMGPAAAPDSVVGSLLVYRAIYYVLPLALGALLLGAYEIRARREAVGRATRFLAPFMPWIPEIVPSLFAIGTFVAGTVLLVSVATPAAHERMRFLDTVLPLHVIETSHFLSSLTGAGLLLLARGLQRRRDGAWVLTAILLAAGIAFSLAKGLDYEEAAVLALILIALLPCRRYFYRKASLLSEPFTPGWIAAIALALLSSIWLGLFSFKHVGYSQELWWLFSLHGDAPRFLRATVGAVGLVLIIAVLKLLRPPAPRLALPAAGELAAARAIIDTAATRTYANLALLGDKSLLWSESRRSFLMFGVEGRSWVALGDPVGSPEEKRELVWRLREICDRHDGWPVFFQVGEESLPLYLELGLNLVKLGEEARVPLADFSLEGSSRKGLRQTHGRVAREGCTFEIIPAEGVPALLGELAAISDAWLAEKSTREKGFSLGHFSPDYLRWFPVAVVRQGGRIVAFANLWSAGEREELSFDLMRHLPDAPAGAMEFLFVELMLWGRERGYRWCDLGMAPLSGIEDRALGSLWNRIGSLIYQQGEHFYNFQGLRRYKEKFDPVWKPLYMASPGALALPTILTNVTALVSGGLKGVIGK